MFLQALNLKGTPAEQTGGPVRLQYSMDVTSVISVDLWRIGRPSCNFVGPPTTEKQRLDIFCGIQRCISHLNAHIFIALSNSGVGCGISDWISG